MRRVVVTGMGVVSPIGNNIAEVTESLRTGKSGITFCEDYAEMGFRSQVHGKPKIDMDDMIDRKLRRFMGDGSAYAQAVGDSKDRSPARSRALHSCYGSRTREQSVSMGRGLTHSSIFVANVGNVSVMASSSFSADNAGISLGRTREAFALRNHVSDEAD